MEGVRIEQVSWAVASWPPTNTDLGWRSDIKSPTQTIRPQFLMRLLPSLLVIDTNHIVFGMNIDVHMTPCIPAFDEDGLESFANFLTPFFVPFRRLFGSSLRMPQSLPELPYVT